MIGLKCKPIKVDLLLYGIALLIITSIFNTSQHGASLSWVFVGALLIFIGGVLINPKIKAKKILLFLFWCVFAISTLASNIVSVQRDLLTFLAFCIVYLFSTSRQYEKKQIDVLIGVYIITAFLCELNIIYNWLIGNYFENWFQRVSFSFLGVYKDPNYTMAFLVPSISMSLFKLSGSTYRVKFFYLTSICMGVFCCILCGSRSAIVAFVCSIIVYMFFNNSSMSKKFSLLIIIAFVALIVYSVMGKVLNIQSLKRIFDMTDGRLVIWQDALNVFFQSPIIGSGLNAASMYTLKSMSINSHNVYLDILCGSGLMGSLIFIMFFLSNCFRCKKSDRAHHFSLIIVFMVPLFFINGFNTATFYVPLILLSIFSEFSIENKDFSIFA